MFERVRYGIPNWIEDKKNERNIRKQETQKKQLLSNKGNFYGINKITEENCFVESIYAEETPLYKLVALNKEAGYDMIHKCPFANMRKISLGTNNTYIENDSRYSGIYCPMNLETLVASFNYAAPEFASKFVGEDGTKSLNELMTAFVSGNLVYMAEKGEGMIPEKEDVLEARDKIIWICNDKKECLTNAPNKDEINEAVEDVLSALEGTEEDCEQ